MKRWQLAGMWTYRRSMAFFKHAFYETGVIEKNPISEDDINIVMELLCRIQPQQLFCAGDLADPHGNKMYI